MADLGLTIARQRIAELLVKITVGRGGVGHQCPIAEAAR